MNLWRRLSAIFFTIIFSCSFGMQAPQQQSQGWWAWIKSFAPKSGFGADIGATTVDKLLHPETGLLPQTEKTAKTIAVYSVLTTLALVFAAKGGSLGVDYLRDAVMGRPKGLGNKVREIGLLVFPSSQPLFSYRVLTAVFPQAKSLKSIIMHAQQVTKKDRSGEKVSYRSLILAGSDLGIKKLYAHIIAEMAGLDFVHLDLDALAFVEEGEKNSLLDSAYQEISALDNSSLVFISLNHSDERLLQKLPVFINRFKRQEIRPVMVVLALAPGITESSNLRNIFENRLSLKELDSAGREAIITLYGDKLWSALDDKPLADSFTDKEFLGSVAARFAKMSFTEVGNVMASLYDKSTAEKKPVSLAMIDELLGG